MNKYSDYIKSDKNNKPEDFLSLIPWVKYKIIVPTQKDKSELIQAFKHFHDSEIDTEYIVVNQLAHEYIEGSNIIVDYNQYYDGK